MYFLYVGRGANPKSRKTLTDFPLSECLNGRPNKGKKRVKGEVIEDSEGGKSNILSLRGSLNMIKSGGEKF